MAVAFGHSSTNASAGANATSTSWSHDATGDNQLVATFSFRGNPGTVTATYNSVSMSAIVSNLGASGGLTFLWVFKLTSPTTGSNTLAASWTNSVRWGAGATSLSGANGGIGTPVTSAGGVANPTASATIGADDLVLGCAAISDSSANYSVSAGTQRWEISDTNWTGAGNGTNTGTGSVAVTYTYGGTEWAIAALPVIAANANTGSGFFAFFNA